MLQFKLSHSYPEYPVQLVPSNPVAQNNPVKTYSRYSVFLYTSYQADIYDRIKLLEKYGRRYFIMFVLIHEITYGCP